MTYDESDQIPKHRSKGGKKKPYRIDIKLSGKWCKWNTYLTAKRRDQALKVLQSKTDHGMQLFQYRASQ